MADTMSLSSTTSGSSRDHLRIRRHLPLDPFEDAAKPTIWNLSLTSIGMVRSGIENQVILVLGEPSSRDLLPLLKSPHFTSSLLILVSHNPPHIPDHHAKLSVLILRLQSTLSSSMDTDPKRLSHVLDVAEAFARQWRTAPTQPSERFRQYREVIPEGEFLREDFGCADRSNNLHSWKLAWKAASASTASLSNTVVSSAWDEDEEPLRQPQASFSRKDLTSASSIYSAASSTTSLSIAPRRRRTLRKKSKSRPSSPPPLSLASALPPSPKLERETRAKNRTFDSVINYINPALSESAMMRYTIVVTDATRPFLCGSSDSSTERDSSVLPNPRMKSTPNLHASPHLSNSPFSLSVSRTPSLSPSKQSFVTSPLPSPPNSSSSKRQKKKSGILKRIFSPSKADDSDSDSVYSVNTEQCPSALPSGISGPSSTSAAAERSPYLTPASSANNSPQVSPAFAWRVPRVDKVEQQLRSRLIHVLPSTGRPSSTWTDLSDMPSQTQEAASSHSRSHSQSQPDISDMTSLLSWTHSHAHLRTRSRSLSRSHSQHPPLPGPMFSSSPAAPITPSEKSKLVISMEDYLMSSFYLSSISMAPSSFYTLGNGSAVSSDVSLSDLGSTRGMRSRDGSGAAYHLPSHFINGTKLSPRYDEDSFESQIRSSDQRYGAALIPFILPANVLVGVPTSSLSKGHSRTKSGTIVKHGRTKSGNTLPVPVGYRNVPFESGSSPSGESRLDGYFPSKSGKARYQHLHVVEIILLGMLDNIATGSGDAGDSADVGTSLPRMWIGNADDISFPTSFQMSCPESDADDSESEVDFSGYQMRSTAPFALKINPSYRNRRSGGGDETDDESMLPTAIPSDGSSGNIPPEVVVGLRMRQSGGNIRGEAQRVKNDAVAGGDNAAPGGGGKRKGASGYDPRATLKAPVQVPGLEPVTDRSAPVQSAVTQYNQPRTDLGLQMTNLPTSAKGAVGLGLAPISGSVPAISTPPLSLMRPGRFGPPIEEVMSPSLFNPRAAPQPPKPLTIHAPTAVLASSATFRTASQGNMAMGRETIKKLEAQAQGLSQPNPREQISDRVSMESSERRRLLRRSMSTGRLGDANRDFGTGIAGFGDSVIPVTEQKEHSTVSGARGTARVNYSRPMRDSPSLDDKFSSNIAAISSRPDDSVTRNMSLVSKTSVQPPTKPTRSRSYTVTITHSTYDKKYSSVSTPGAAVFGSQPVRPGPPPVDLPTPPDSRVNSFEEYTEQMKANGGESAYRAEPTHWTSPDLKRRSKSFSHGRSQSHSAISARKIADTTPYGGVVFESGTNTSDSSSQEQSNQQSFLTLFPSLPAMKSEPQQQRSQQTSQVPTPSATPTNANQRRMKYTAEDLLQRRRVQSDAPPPGTITREKSVHARKGSAAAHELAIAISEFHAQKSPPVPLRGSAARRSPPTQASTVHVPETKDVVSPLSQLKATLMSEKQTFQAGGTRSDSLPQNQKRYVMGNGQTDSKPFQDPSARKPDYASLLSAMDL